MKLLSSVVRCVFHFLGSLVASCRAIERRMWGKSLEGKVVLLTGASSGIGRELARELFKNGCLLVLASRDVDALSELREELMDSQQEKVAKTPIVLELDLCDDAAIVKVAFEAAVQGGRIDILVNCAGVSHRGSVLGTDIAVHKKIMQVNYFGPVLLTTEVLKPMVERGNGHVVNVSSLQGLVPLPYRSAYCTSKHALQAFSDSLRMELAIKGLDVAVTVVSPGYVNTNLSSNALTGSGEQHGILDANTRRGFEAGYVAAEIVNAICLEEQEVVVAKLHHSLAVYLRRLTPKIFFKLMELREASA